MASALCYPTTLPKLCREFTLNPKCSQFSPSFFPKSRFLSSGPLFKLCCSRNGWGGEDPFENFSALETDAPWDSADIWSTLAGYIFTLHVPLSFGGVAFVSKTLRPSLDPLTMALSIIVIQIIELSGAMLLLSFTAKKEYQISSFFIGKLFSEKRSWIKASATGAVFLIVLMFLTSSIADSLLEAKEDVNDPIMKMFLDSPLSKTATVFLLCFTTPLLEETIYRGFLLTSLAKEMKWWKAIITSACVFSIAHFSFESSLQLFLVGTILGSVYCWSGNLAAPFLVHSLYNAAVLLLDYMP
ncbi:Type II CAAX prenyl endopeptidase Rce1-like protein [Dioscorea alata]|uniref:Type II CAAX prenyl endopeptidase Rce1-like protein n=1 Tax=Dioscorea alata TaxID=55571 RepID=A0ACB7TZ83_DIOAL|nr:Type II CAAX prenyl endopeptidase Rce1-like protein [Dioscorea alata]